MTSGAAKLRWLVVPVLCFAAGVGGTLVVDSGDRRGAAEPESASSAACIAIPAEEISAATKLTALLANTTVAKNLVPSEPESFNEMFELARRDPTSRRELFDHYRSAPAGEAKQMLRSLLMNLRTPDVTEFFMQLAASADPLQRQDGFEVLRISGTKLPEVRQLALETIRAEQDPAILSEALGALRPAIAADSEQTQVMGLLQEHARDSEPTVRAQSVRMLAAWDKAGEAVPYLQRALADDIAEVRSAAVVGIIDNRLRNDALKRQLLGIAHNAAESPGLRMNAVLALERYPLSEQEHARLVQSATEADQLLGAQDAAMRSE